MVGESWDLASDGLQWILRKSYKNKKTGERMWRTLSFVRSSRYALWRCMLQAGVPGEAAMEACEKLPETFLEWLDGLQDVPSASHSATEAKTDAE